MHSEHGTETTYAGTSTPQRYNTMNSPKNHNFKVGISNKLDDLRAKVDFLIHDREKSLERSKNLSRSKEKKVSHLPFQRY